MHIPVLLCGLLCGPLWGGVCGALAPVLSSLATSMPAAAMLPAMTGELLAYGLAAGLIMMATKKLALSASVYISLVGAMICGRLVSGALSAWVFGTAGYGFSAWLSASFVVAWPGILIQLALIPPVVLGLKKAKLA
jgi:niacin transporter